MSTTSSWNVSKGKPSPSLDEALRYGVEIADALDRAHSAGVVHRDLKPGNIMLTPTGPKLLDFGLATHVRKDVLGSDPASSNLPTLQKPLTKEGTVLGTVQYMAPEQLEGKEADARTDLFAFGAVLYEMVTGRKAFSGKSSASLIAAILEHDPTPVSELQRLSPPLLDRAIGRCLVKDAERRWQTARDLKEELEWIAESPADANVAIPKAATWKRAIPYFVAGLLGAILTAIGLWNVRDPVSPRIARFVMPSAPGVPFYFHRDPNVAISPDGSRIVYAGGSGADSLLYVRPIGSLDATPISGAEHGHSPFFSPSGEWVGFFSDDPVRELKKVPLAGGHAVSICEAPTGHLGASWAEDGTIVFASAGMGLSRVSADGGSPETLTTPDANAGEARHMFPEVLPGGRGIVFTVRTATEPSETIIAVLRPGERTHEILVTGGIAPRYVPTGHLLYWVGGDLMAAPFDPDRLDLTGPAASVVEGVATSQDGPPVVAFSQDGTLIYAPGEPAVFAESQRLVSMDRQSGATTEIADGAFWHPRLSPDGRRIAAEHRERAPFQIWLHDIERRTRSRLTFEGESRDPLWTPDGERIVFRWRYTETDSALAWQASDGSGDSEVLVPGSWVPYSWSSDGKILALYKSVFWVDPEENRTPTGRDIYTLSLEGDRTPLPFVVTQFNEHSPTFSPDERYIAYVSDESGDDEVYVQPFPGPGPKVTVSMKGGREPVWSADGTELFYRRGNDLMVVPISTTPTLELETPQPLLDVSAFVSRRRGPGGRNYDVSRDGGRFLFVTRAEYPRDLHVVLNWYQELERLVPTN